MFVIVTVVFVGVLHTMTAFSRSLFGGINLKELAMGLKSPNVSQCCQNGKVVQ